MRINAINSINNQAILKSKISRKIADQPTETEKTTNESVSFKANWKNLLKPSNFVGALCTFGMAIPFIVAETEEDNNTGEDPWDHEDFDTYYHTHLP